MSYRVELSATPPAFPPAPVPSHVQTFQRSTIITTVALGALAIVVGSLSESIFLLAFGCVCVIAAAVVSSRRQWTCSRTHTLFTHRHPRRPPIQEQRHVSEERIGVGDGGAYVPRYNPPIVPVDIGYHTPTYPPTHTPPAPGHLRMPPMQEQRHASEERVGVGDGGAYPPPYNPPIVPVDMGCHTPSRVGVGDHGSAAGVSFPPTPSAPPLEPLLHQERVSVGDGQVRQLRALGPTGRIPVGQ